MVDDKDLEKILKENADTEDTKEQNTEQIVNDLLGQILVRTKQPELTPEDIERAESLKSDKKYLNKRLGEILTEIGLVTEKDVDSALLEQEKIRKSKKK